MKVKCSKCHKPMNKKGAIILSPPCNTQGLGDFRKDLDVVVKYHICIKCNIELQEWFNQDQ